MKDSLIPAREVPRQVADSIEQRKVTYDALILDAGLRQSLVTTRSLGHRGLRVAALEVTNKVETSSSVPTFSSHWCSQKFVAPSYEQQTEAFFAYLEQALEHTGAQVLLTLMLTRFCGGPKVGI
jgi:hypothetical protein